MAGPSGPLNPVFMPRSLSETTGQQTLPPGVSSTMLPSEVLPPKMAIQPPSLRQRFVLSQPEIVAPVPPVTPTMTKAQEEEMKGWFLKEVWSNIMERLKDWGMRGIYGIRNFTANSPAATARLADREDFRDAVSAKKRWGEERDSWLNPGWAPYFGGQWIGVLPGPAPTELPAVPMGIDDDEDAAGDVPCEP